MKRLLGILTICLLSFAGKADTIGVYRVMLHGTEVASATEFNTINITLSAKDLKATDTLFISYWSCGARYAGNHSLVVLDSLSQKEIIKSSFYADDYTLPLKELLLYERTHPGAVFTGTFRTHSKSNSHTVRFRLVIN